MSHLLEVVDLFREYIANRYVDVARLDATQKTLAFALDEQKVNNRPTEELESLYDAVMWLRCNILEI